jgi:hypothetical protein
MQRTPDGRPLVVVDPDVSHLVRHAFELYATGNYSFKLLSSTLYDDGLMTDKGLRLSAGYVQQMLQNPFYAGRICWQGETHQGTHEALVTEETFNKVQAAMRARDRGVAGRDSALYFWLRGVAICKQCGHRMTAERHRRWSYYRCSKTTIDRRQCDGTYANADAAHETMKQAYQAFRIPESLKDALMKSAQAQIGARVAAAQLRAKSLNMRRTKLEAKQVTTAEKYAAGDIEPMVYRALSTKMNHEMQVIEQQLADAGQSHEALLAKVRRTIAAASSLWHIHSRLDQRGQHRLLRAVFREIVFNEGRIESVALNPPFDAIASASNREPPSGDDPVAPDLDLNAATAAINSILEHDLEPLLHLEREAAA